MRATPRVTLLVFAALLALGDRDPGAVVAQDIAAFDVIDKSIPELQAALTAGRVSSEQLVELYVQRIRAYDDAGPRLNAVLYVNPNAAREARTLDEERRRGGARGPLHGIPILIKDNFDTRDMPTTGGSLALVGLVSREDAHQVKRLRDAGAVILGKVNLHELALGLTTVSSLGGQTRNPYDPSRAPGGSSGGSGVAAAASFAAATLGTDTSGSIRIPSSHNNIVGLRPTAGLTSRAGIIPFSHTQDTGGPMARTVTDVAIVLDATAGVDPRDPITAEAKGRVPASYAAALRIDALNGARIGVLTELFGNAPDDEPVAAVVRRAVEEMKARGATAVDVTVPNLTQQLMASNLLSQELKWDFRDYMRGVPNAPIRTLEELLASGLHTAQFQAFVEGANALPDDYPSSADYRNRLAARETLRAAVLKVMDENRVEVLVYPTVRRIAPLVAPFVAGNQPGSNAGLSAQTGFPAITVPAGFTSGGFPAGVELLGRPFSEATMLALAFSYESATRHRRAPASLPSLAVPTRRLLAEPPLPDPRGVRFEVKATAANAVPPSRADFEALVAFWFEDASRELWWNVTGLTGSEPRIRGIYLHRRANRPNGGVAHILAESPALRSRDWVRLSEAEAADLKAGKFYVSAIDATDPRVSARGNLVLP